jgi:hypothetical protein
MPNKYSPPTDQSIIFLATDIIKADTYNQNIKAPDVKLEHLISFLDKNNTNGLNGTYQNAQGVSYQNIAPSALSTNKIVYTTDFLSAASLTATAVNTVYLSSAVAIPVNKTGLVTKLNLGLNLLGVLIFSSYGNSELNFVFSISYTIRVLECDTFGGTYTPIFTKSDTKKIQQILNMRNLTVLLSQSTSSTKYIKLEFTITEGSALTSTTANDDILSGVGIPPSGCTWSLTASFDPSSTYEIQKSFA